MSSTHTLLFSVLSKSTVSFQSEAQPLKFFFLAVNLFFFFLDPCTIQRNIFKRYFPFESEVLAFCLIKAYKKRKRRKSHCTAQCVPLTKHSISCCNPSSKNFIPKCYNDHTKRKSCTFIQKLINAIHTYSIRLALPYSTV